MKRAAVVKGRYPARLQACWTQYANSARGTENDDPSMFDEEQCYIVFACQNGGTDLESFNMRTFGEAKCMLLQVRCLYSCSVFYQILLGQVWVVATHPYMTHSGN